MGVGTIGGKSLLVLLLPRMGLVRKGVRLRRSVSMSVASVCSSTGSVVISFEVVGDQDCVFAYCTSWMILVWMFCHENGCFEQTGTSSLTNMFSDRSKV